MNQTWKGIARDGVPAYLVIVDPQDVLFRYLEIALRKGFRTLVLALDPAACHASERRYNELAYGSANSRIDRLIQCNTGNANDIVRALEPAAGQIAGLLPGDDANVPATFAAGRAMGFDCATAQDAVCQQSKSAMKQRLVERGVPTPSFRLATSLAEAERHWAEFGGDCMVKMVDYCDSANVSRARTRDELARAWRAIVENDLGIVLPVPLADEALLEEVVTGRELSAEGYVQEDRVTFLSFCEKVTSSNFIVVGHVVPAALAPAEQAAVERVVSECVRALGIRNSVFHAEVHVRDCQPYVIECATRPPGQHIVDLIKQSRGTDLMEIAIDLAIGRRVEERLRPVQRHFVMFALYTEESGVLAGVAGLDHLHRLGGVQRVHLDATPGERVEALRTFRHRYGFVVVEDDSAVGAQEKAAWLRTNVRLELAGASRPIPRNIHDRIEERT